VKRC